MVDLNYQPRLVSLPDFWTIDRILFISNSFEIFWPVDTGHPFQPSWYCLIYSILDSDDQTPHICWAGMCTCSSFWCGNMWHTNENNILLDLQSMHHLCIDIWLSKNCFTLSDYAVSPLLWHPSPVCSCLTNNNTLPSKCCWGPHMLGGRRILDIAWRFDHM